MTGATNAPAERPAVATIERPDIAAKIQSKFDAVFADVNEADLTQPDVTDEADPSTEEEAAKPSDTEDADEKAAETEAGTSEDEAGETEETEEQADKQAEAAATATAPTLPAAYRRTLKAYEWSDEEIEANLKAIGPKFIETAGRMHANRNKEVAAWAEAGRQAKAAAPKTEAATEPAAMQPIDAKALKAKYGEEELIDALVGPVNRTIEQINRMMPIAAAAQQQAQMQQLDALGRQIDGFFGGKEMEAHKDVYGTATAALTDKQASERTKVLELADALIGGARLQGRNLPLNEALQMAFDSTTSGTQKQAARKEITTQLKARSKGITLKPSAKARAVTSSPAGNRSELEKRVSQSLRMAFN